MTPSRRELGTPARLIGFAVVLAAVFGLAFLTGSRFGPDVATAPDAAATFDRNGTYAMFVGFNHDGAVHRAVLVADVA